MIDNEDNFSIRPEDFRKSWPHALAIASEEFFETVRILEATQEKIYMLVRTTPVMLKIAQDHVMDSSKRGIEAIEAAYAQFTLAQNELTKAREDFLKLMKTHKISIESTISDAKKMQTEAKFYLLKAQAEKAKLDAEKLAFSSLGLLERIFYNKRIKK